jgi:hypothetical protein
MLGCRRPVRRAESTATLMCRFSRNSGRLRLLEPRGSVQACSGIAFYCNRIREGCDCRVTDARDGLSTAHARCTVREEARCWTVLYFYICWCQLLCVVLQSVFHLTWLTVVRLPERWFFPLLLCPVQPRRAPCNWYSAINPSGLSTYCCFFLKQRPVLYLYSIMLIRADITTLPIVRSFLQ